MGRMLLPSWISTSLGGQTAALGISSRIGVDRKSAVAVSRGAFRSVGIAAPLGGAEYGSDVAAVMDLYVAGRANSGFGHFVADRRRSEERRGGEQGGFSICGDSSSSWRCRVWVGCCCRHGSLRRWAGKQRLWAFRRGYA